MRTYFLKDPVAFGDFIRSRLLRRTLKYRFLQRVYSDRVKRITFQCLIGIAVSAFLIAILPELAFYLGPLLLGIPHVIASFRFSGSGPHKGKDQRSKLISLIGLSLIVGIACRYLQMDHFFTAEVLALVGTVYIFSGRVGYSSLIGALFIATQFQFPLELGLALLIGHNFIAFIFWFLECKTLDQKKSVGLCLLALIVTSGFLIALPLHAMTLSNLLFSNFHNSFVNDAILKVFLLSQSVHYFIWLKAIPEYRSSAPTPAPFSFTLKKVFEDLGARTVWICIFICAFIAFLIFQDGLEEARQLYILVSASHGFVEIGMLFVVFQKGLLNRQPDLQTK